MDVDGKTIIRFSGTDIYEYVQFQVCAPQSDILVSAGLIKNYNTDFDDILWSRVT